MQAVGCERLYQEKISGVDSTRPELATMLDYVRENDVVVVCKLDRLARSTKHLLVKVDVMEGKGMEGKGVALRIFNINLDTGTPTGKMMLTMLAAIGQFEREMMLERQRDGIAKAKEEGKYKGRKATARAKSVEVASLLAEGKTKEAIAAELAIGVASVYRISKDLKANF